MFTTAYGVPVGDSAASKRALRAPGRKLPSKPFSFVSKALISDLRGGESAIREAIVNASISKIFWRIMTAPQRCAALTGVPLGIKPLTVSFRHVENLHTPLTIIVAAGRKALTEVAFRDPASEPAWSSGGAVLWVCCPVRRGRGSIGGMRSSGTALNRP